jgi:two-component system, OmpR family, heavy metal sensor histidine kinase CusS
MTPRSIRARLTLWYFAVLLVTFIAFGTGIFVVMWKSVHAAIDDDLQVRFAGITSIMQGHDPAESLEAAVDEFEEHAGLVGNLLQVADGGRNWIFRSASIRNYDIRLPALEPNESRYETLRLQSRPFRVLSERVNVSGNDYTIQLATPIDDAYHILTDFQWVLLTSIPVVLVFASGGGYWMSRRALSPVDRIASTARSISERNLSMRLAIPSTADELQRLSETFNQMMDRLETAFRRITQFTADASHELRTPVALIRTAAEISLRRERGDPDYREALSQILEESARMSVLIESLMTMARMDCGVEGLKLETIDVLPVLREACEKSGPLARLKQIDFKYALPDGPVLVNGQSQELRRLVLILIDNAIKYTLPRGRISVELSKNDQTAVIAVRDSGIGISEQDLPFIFDRFYRADKARSRDEGGAGLGLSIGRWIAEAHGGSIHVSSAPGEGTTFEVRIPLVDCNRKIGTALSQRS